MKESPIELITISIASIAICLELLIDIFRSIVSESKSI